MLRILTIASLLSLALATRHLVSLRSTGDESREFDYFMFVRQWPGSFCAKHSCPLLHDRGYHFTIHGLWPNFNDGSWPQFCKPDYKFDESELADLEEVLEEEWPSFYNSYADFWEHEWSKHGTCALNVLPNEHTFFKAILKLHWKYDLAAALRAADIVPSLDQTYHAKDLADAIADMYTARPLVHCTGKELSEVWMCFDKDLRPFDCDPSHERNNCDEVSIPPLKSLEGHEAEDAQEDGTGYRYREEAGEQGQREEEKAAAVA